MRNLFYLTTSLFLVLGACSSEIEPMQDIFEATSCACIDTAYASHDIDINAQLKAYEKDLIANQHIPDSSAASYLALVEEIAHSGQLKFSTDFVIEGWEMERVQAFAHCFYMYKDDPVLEASNSKLKGIYHVYDSISQAAEFSPQVVAGALLEVLDVNDFKKPFYKLYVRHVLYSFAHPVALEVPVAQQPYEGPKISIVIDELEGIMLEGEQVEIENLVDSLQAFTAGWTDAEKADVLIALKVSNDVKMGVVSEVKGALREANLNKVAFGIGE